MKARIPPPTTEELIQRIERERPPAYTPLMPEQIQRHQLTHRMDAYLDSNGHSEPSLIHVINVLVKFDYMVSLATERALEALPLPQTDDVPHMATVLQFQRELPYPDTADDSDPYSA